MQVTEQLPTNDPVGRHDLITAASRAAFRSEAAEQAGDAREEARQRVIYHRAQAELLARTTAFNDEAQARVDENRDAHRRKAAAYQRELEQLEGRGA